MTAIEGKTGDVIRDLETIWQLRRKLVTSSDKNESWKDLEAIWPLKRKKYKKRAGLDFWAHLESQIVMRNSV